MDAQAEATAIRNAVTSTNNCNLETVTSLQRLLGKSELQSELDGSEKLSAKLGATKLQSKPTAAKKTTRSKNGPTAVVSLGGTYLSATEQYKLATDVANTTLKVLTASLRERPSQSPRKSSSPNAKKRFKDQPLREIVNPPGVRDCDCSCKDTSHGSATGQVAMAECSRLAFSHLRLCSPEKLGFKPLPAWQLEQGSLALVAKMVGLDMQVLAIKELRLLKRRFEKACGYNSTQERKGPPEKETLAGLLRLKIVKSPKDLVPILVTYQTYVMKIISTTKKAAVIEEVVDYLDPTSPESPSALIMQCVDADTDSGKKARQLESLAQRILAMCSRAVAVEDEASKDRGLYADPRSILRLQSFALTVRQIWWKLAAHRVNLDRELFDPLSDYLDEFSRRSREGHAETYSLAKLIVEKALISLNEDSKYKAKKSCVIHRLLSSMAQAAGEYEEAIGWTHKMQQESNGMDNAEATASSIRAITLSLVSSRKSVRDLGLELKSCVRSKILGLKGFDHALAELVNLREALLRRLTALEQTTMNGTESKEDVGPVCEMLYECAMFLNRYLEHLRQNPRDGGTGNPSPQALLTTQKLVRPFIDSTLFSVKLWISERLPVEEPVIEVLDCCRSLVQSASEDDLKLVNVHISNVFYLAFMAVTKDTTDHDQSLALRSLMTSVQVLSECSDTEQASGLLAMKLDKLINLLRSLGQYDKAIAWLQTSIHLHLKTGTVEEFKDAMHRMSVKAAIKISDKTQALERILQVYHKMSLKIEDNSSIFCDDTLDLETTAALLELQLSFVQESVLQYPNHLQLKGDVNLILSTLTDYYTSSALLIRRAQLSSVIMYLHLRGSTSIDLQLVQQAKESELVSATSSLDNPSILFINSSLSTMKALLDPEDSMSGLESSLFNLKSALQDAVSHTKLIDLIYDAELLISQLSIVASFLAIRGEDELRLIALQLLFTLQEVSGFQSSELTSTTTIIALQYLQMGRIDHSREYLNKAEILSKGRDVPHRVQQQLFDVKIRLLTSMGDLQSARIATLASDKLMESNLVSDLSRSARHWIKADAGMSHALFQLESGLPNEALHHAKRSVLMYQALIAAGERNSGLKSPQELSQNNDVQALTDGIKNLAIASDRNTRKQLLSRGTSNCSSWKYAPGLMEALVTLSLIYAHQGLRAEAQYYAEQLAKLVDTVRSPMCALRFRTLELQLAYLAGASNTKPPSDVLESVLHDCGRPTRHIVSYLIARGDLFARNGDFKSALGEYGVARPMIDRLISAASGSNSESDGIDNITPNSTKKAAGTKLTRKKTAVISKSKGGRTRTLMKSTSAQPVARSPEPLTVPSADCSLLASCHSQLDTQQALVYLQQGDLSSASALLDADVIVCGAENGLKRGIAAAKLTLLKVTEELSTDFTFNVLPESTLSLPALMHGGRQQTQIAMLPSSPIALAPSSKKTASKLRSGPKAVTTVSPTEESRVTSALQTSRQILSSSLSKDAQSRSLSSVFQLSRLAVSSTMLLSATEASITSSQALHPARVVFSIDLPEIEAVQRQIDAVALDSRHDSLNDAWVGIGSALDCTAVSPTAANYQQDFIEIIPESWTAVSINLSEDSSELYVTRYHSGQSPFLLRLPMARHKPSDLNDEEAGFDFEAGRAELTDIIQLSDYSCHHAPDVSVKGARQIWWTEREALDQRMHELLLNMENIWLGGFKGILSQHTRHADLIARFRKSFDNILDRHLPSRQGTKAKGDNLALETHVLQLFIGLGYDNDGEIELDEQVLDLLYFVVDILQFNGEHNAYDEMDFDSMTIETLDAMRAYHESAGMVDTSDKHMILILDKRLHCFPWESLLILQDKNVSRVGSMLHLRERILALRRQKGEDPSTGGKSDKYLVPRTSGTYILNPSNDLKSTQQTLEPLLSPLQSMRDSSWISITARAPSEQEFTNELSTSSIFLYFGHGSGNQYVRNRSIRKLDKCSEVVWLIGCSSGAVTENGDFQPVSVPLAYLIAGCDERQKEAWERRAKHLPVSDTPTVETSPSTSGESKKAMQSLKQVKTAKTARSEKPKSAATQSPEPCTDKTCQDPNTGRTGLTMSIIATLWDVTDKDIDRFSVATAQTWGLFHHTNNPVSSSTTTKVDAATVIAPKTPSRAKTPNARSKTPAPRGQQESKTPARNAKTPAKRGRAAGGAGAAEEPKTAGGRRSKSRINSDDGAEYQREEGERGLSEGKSLVQAVVQGREACYLRYLNGAAVVVYGVPTYLGP